MAWIEVWPGGPMSLAEAEAYIKADPPGSARCSCGELARFVASSETGSNPAEHTFSLEAFCGDESHRQHGLSYTSFSDHFVARDGEWVRRSDKERAAEYAERRRSGR